VSDFDAGINTSAAFTEHLEQASECGPGSLSDEEPGPDSDDQEDEGRPARALYQFEGKPEFRELSVEAGDEVKVMKEDLADGWSLVKIESGEVGLLPRTYYIVCPVS
jgi:sorting nexin-9/18/33